MANHSDNEKKPIYKKLWFWVIVIIIVIIFFGSNQDFQKGVNDGFNNVANNEIEAETNSGLKTSFEWTNQGTDEYVTSYLVLIGNNNYSDGQNYEKIEAGTYTFKENNDREIFPASEERVYNIYITDQYIDLESFEDEKMNYLEGTVGGANAKEIDIELKDGQFLYVQNVPGGSHGHLVVEKK